MIVPVLKAFYDIFSEGVRHWIVFELMKRAETLDLLESFSNPGNTQVALGFLLFTVGKL